MLHVTTNMAAERKVRYQPPGELLLPIEVPQRLLMGAGPSNCPPRILRAAALPMLGELHPEFTKVMDDIKAGVQYAFQTANPLSLAISGTGHAGMEAAIVNVVERGDTVMVLKNGIWGIRAEEVAVRCGAVVHTLTRPPGEIFTLEEIEDGLRKYSPSVLFVCHGESTGGVCQPLEGVGDLCHRYECLVVVDAVASLGGTPFYMDEWGIDVAFSGAQKVLNALPGAAPISFSPRARARIATRHTKVQSFYFDVEWLAKYWGVDVPTPINVFYALREALSMLAEEGLEASWLKHRATAEYLWAGLENLGLELLVKDKDIRLPTVTPVKVVRGMDPAELPDFLINRHSIEIVGGLGGPTEGKVWRVGLLGYNCTRENVDRVLKALKDGLQNCSTGQ